MKKKPFYGWYIVGITFICLLLTYGTRLAFGVFLPPMLKDLQWTRTLSSGAASISSLTVAICAPIVGIMMDKWGAKYLMAGGALLMGLSLSGIYFITQPWQFYLLYGFLFSVGVSGCGMVVCNTAVNNWFVKKRGLAIGITLSGTSAGMFFISPLSNALISNFGWRTSFVLLGVIIAVILIPLAFLLKNRPEDDGLKPDGIDADKANEEKQKTVKKVEPIVTAGEGLKSGSMWILILAYGFFLICWSLLNTHFVLYAIGLGVEQTTAVTVFALIGGISIAGKLVIGYFADKVRHKKYIIFLSYMMAVMAMIVLLLVKNLTGLYITALLFAFGYGGFGLYAALCGDLFGRPSMGKLYGFITVGGTLGSAIGPILGGLLYDKTQSYSISWIVSIILLGLAGVSMLLLNKPLYYKKLQQENVVE